MREISKINYSELILGLNIYNKIIEKYEIYKQTIRRTYNIMLI